MRRLMCIGCGFSEDLDDPIGNVHRVRLVDLTPTFDTPKGPDKSVEEDLCKECRDKLRRDFFGAPDPELLEMPLMRHVKGA
jgi:hypothetical protein